MTIEEKISNFIGKASSKIREISTEIIDIMKEESWHDPIVRRKVLTIKLLRNFIKCLDHSLNDWTNKEIAMFIDSWSSDLDLNNIVIPVVDPLNKMVRPTVLVKGETVMIEVPKDGSGLLRKKIDNTYIWEPYSEEIDLGSPSDL